MKPNELRAIFSFMTGHGPFNNNKNPQNFTGKRVVGVPTIHTAQMAREVGCVVHKQRAIGRVLDVEPICE